MGYNSNKAKQTDSVHGVRLVVSPRLNFTTRQTPHTLRLFAALYENSKKTLRNEKITKKIHHYKEKESRSWKRLWNTCALSVLVIASVGV